MTSEPPPGDSGAWGPPHFAPVPFDRFRAELLALYEPPLRAKATYSGIRSMLDVVASVLGPDATTADLTPAFVARLIASRSPELSSHTVKTLVTRVKVACSYALSQGYIRSSPFAFRKSWVRVGDAVRKRHHSIEDIRRVLDLLAGEVEGARGWPRWRARRLQALVATVAYTGLRAQEAIGLKSGDVDLGGRILMIVSRAGNRLKTVASAQPVPVPEPLAAILAGWMEHRTAVPESGKRPPPECDWLFPNVTRTNRWTAGPVGFKPIDQIKLAGVRAGVDGFTFLSLRHSFATHAEHWGLSPAMLQRVLRHTSIKTQWHYRHADLSNIRAAVGGIDFGPPAPPIAGAGPETGESP